MTRPDGSLILQPGIFRVSAVRSIVHFSASSAEGVSQSTSFWLGRMARALASCGSWAGSLAGASQSVAESRVMRARAVQSQRLRSGLAWANDGKTERAADIVIPRTWVQDKKPEKPASESWRLVCQVKDFDSAMATAEDAKLRERGRFLFAVFRRNESALRSRAKGLTIQLPRAWEKAKTGGFPGSSRGNGHFA